MRGVDDGRRLKAREILEALDRSQQSLAAFCRAQCIPADRLYRWRRQLRAKARPAAVAVGDLVPIRIREPSPGPTPAVVIRLGDGAVVEVLSSASPAWVASLLRELGAR